MRRLPGAGGASVEGGGARRLVDGSTVASSINQAAEESAVRENMLGTAILLLPLVVSAVLG